MTSELFEQRIRELTQAVNGQYPRPWISSLRDPLQARVFIVGMNQRNGYDVEQVGSHARHLDALFNRNGLTCRGIYDEMTRGRPSPTRANIDRLTSLLKDVGVREASTGRGPRRGPRSFAFSWRRSGREFSLHTEGKRAGALSGSRDAAAAGARVGGLTGGCEISWRAVNRRRDSKSGAASVQHVVAVGTLASPASGTPRGAVAGLTRRGGGLDWPILAGRYCV
jgi:hypothetical protein